MRDTQAFADAVVLTVKAALGPVYERLALAEAKLAQMAATETVLLELRDRVVAAETKAAMLTAPDPDVIVRVAALESKAAAPAPVVDLEDMRRRLDALEARPVAVPEDVATVRDRLVAIETKADGLSERLTAPSPLAAAIDRTERTLTDLAKDVGTLRERVAVVEVRALVPGPAGRDGVDGQNGKDGADGLGFDDLVAEQTDDRSVTIKAVKGDRVKAIGTARFPVQIQRGVYVEGKAYELGDVVTWAGSQWHANEPTTARPGEGSKAWTLIVKRGRDGRDGRDAAGALPVVTVGASGG